MHDSPATAVPPRPWTIVVLMGGSSAEREVSLDSGRAVAAALTSRGHVVEGIDFRDPLRDVDSTAVREADVVFVALHGGAGEDGRVQALLELAGKTYVGSGPGASALAMDKVWSKHLAERLGVATPDWIQLCGDASEDDIRAKAGSLGFPVVLKPAAEGSSVGVCIARDEDELVSAWRNDHDRAERWLLERLVAGREITLPMLGGEPLPILEIRPVEGFYDYANKYTKGRCEYDCPASVTDDVANAVVEVGTRMAEALRLRDLARIDFRLDDDGGVWFLEANTIPGMTDLSLLPMAAAVVGIGFAELCERLCQMALERGPATTGRTT